MQHIQAFLLGLLHERAIGHRVAALPAPGGFVAPFSFRDIEAICRFSRPRHFFAVRLSFFGSFVPRAAYQDSHGFVDFETLQRFHQGGATLIVNQVHRLSGPVARLAQDLGRLLHCGIGVNCYATPRGARGFAFHVDPHDVLILQLSGRKRWALGARAPRVRGEYTIDDSARHFETEERVLAPGDVLYIPAGFAHAAKSIGDETSIHLTIGFRPPTWAALMRSWVDASAARDDRLHDPLPLDTTDLPGDGAIGARARELLQGMLATPLEDAVQGLFDGAPGGPAGHSDGDDDVAPALIAEGTRLRRRSGIDAAMFAGALILTTAAGAHLELRAEYARAWDVFGRHDILTPHDLAGTVPPGCETLFCYYLLNNGAIERVPEAA